MRWGVQAEGEVGSCTHLPGQVGIPDVLAVSGLSWERASRKAEKHALVRGAGDLCAEV